MGKAKMMREAEVIFRRANSDAGMITIVWTMKPTPAHWPTGMRGYGGRFLAIADGYRKREILVEWDHLGRFTY
jgi:hypothetical protein